MVFDQLEQEVKDITEAQEEEGKLQSQTEDDKLMHSVLAADKQTMEHGELIQEAANRNVGAFTPDLLFEKLVKNFQIAKQLYGEKIIRMLSGYDPKYIEKNANIPEFRRELRQALAENVQGLKDEGLLTKDGIISDAGAELGALVLIKELDAYITKDQIGEKVNKHAKHYGDRGDIRPFRSGDRYKDIHLKKSVHRAIRRQHDRIHPEDLMTAEREGRGHVSIIFALDASASMKGSKIETCKKAGITLAHKAIHDRNDVGLIIFGSDIKHSIAPTKDFGALLRGIATIRAGRQTDFAGMIERSIELFSPSVETKHLIILTDALPTVGDAPEQTTLHAVGKARGSGITVSLIGVQLDQEGEELAREITRIGEGRFTVANNLENVGQVVLEDYYSVR